MFDAVTLKELYVEDKIPPDFFIGLRRMYIEEGEGFSIKCGGVRCTICPLVDRSCVKEGVNITSEEKSNIVALFKEANLYPEITKEAYKVKEL